MIANLILIVVVLGVAFAIIRRFITKRQNEESDEKMQVDDRTYTLEMMISFVKRRLDEITKINLYDIGLSEEELKRRKNKKYELKKALKGCTYGDVNDKKYIKELIYDMLYNEYGVNETNVSKAIPFDVPSLLTAQDKFDIILYFESKSYFPIINIIFVFFLSGYCSLSCFISSISSNPCLNVITTASETWSIADLSSTLILLSTSTRTKSYSLLANFKTSL